MLGEVSSVGSDQPLFSSPHPLSGTWETWMALNVNWLRQCRRAGLYEQGKAIYEKGGLNLANLTDEQHSEAEDDYRICVRRGRDEETKPRRQRPITTEDDKEETTMTRTLYGKVHGKTIELDEDLGLAEGQEVEVQVRMIGPKKRLPGPPPGWRPGGTETAAGMMAEHWTEEDDRILEAIERDRHRPSTRELPE